MIKPVLQMSKTGYKEFRLGDLLNGHKSEYSNLGVNLKGLILITNCRFSHYLFSPGFFKEAVKANIHPCLLPFTAHLLPPQAVSFSPF